MVLLFFHSCHILQVSEKSRQRLGSEGPHKKSCAHMHCCSGPTHEVRWQSQAVDFILPQAAIHPRPPLLQFQLSPDIASEKVKDHPEHHSVQYGALQVEG
ncbi:Hypothetical predicted protein [Podarcis lilfordi]|uniref:Uncharacterized protein n=1 Tax=Podarcis lilfordi TaxID=74358 RepID=A0AA35PKW5_9SAUR|nr:Hypothetical predicted protein [Podarcis lilfordi]